jgi:hypothetical protein
MRAIDSPPRKTPRQPGFMLKFELFYFRFNTLISSLNQG